MTTSERPGRIAEDEQLPVLTPGQTIASVSDKISAIVLTRRTPRGWFIGFGLAFLL
jgi:molybdopterin-containing oxidoreductase family membrane subunit